MTDLASVQEGAEKAESKMRNVSQTETTTTTTESVAAVDPGADTTSSFRPPSDQRGISQPPTRPRPGSRASDSGRPADLPKRPEPERSASQRQQGRPPRHGDARLPPRPDLQDDRRDRHLDFNPRTRHALPDPHRPFDGSGTEARGHGREREVGIRPPPEEPMRGPPYRDGRAPREPDWPGDRSGRSRLSDQFQGRDGPPRGDLLPDVPGGPRRGEAMRADRPTRTLSPPRSELPNRPERAADERRSANFTPLAHRHDEFPRGPRDRGFDMRDATLGPDMSHGRLRQPEPPSEIPSGPRGGRARGNRNVSGPPPNGNIATPERQLPTGPSRQSGRGAPEPASVAPTPPADALNTSGIHPDRLGLFGAPQQAPPAAMTPPSGPRGGPQSGSRGPGGDRGRSDKRFAGLNNVLQQTNSPTERSGPTPPMRGRGSNRQSNGADTGSPQTSNRPPTGPAADDDNQPRNRPDMRDDLMDNSTPESRRPGRDRNRDKDRDRERRAEDAGGSTGSNRREERRDRGRDSDRERSRRSDAGGGAGRDEKERDRERHTEGREALRRNPGSREESRRRDRRDRDDGLPDTSGPIGNTNANDNEGRLRPPSSMGAPPPPPPPPPPPLPTDENNPRRWGPGGERGSRPDNRDRERERRGDRGRERDQNRESGGGSTHRKRGRPNPEDNAGGEGNPRGPRMGNDNKRPRRGQ